jgi:hypothetical protein
MAGKFRTAANGFLDEVEELATEHEWQVRRSTIGQTEGGAGTVSVTFVQKLDGDDALNGTPMGAAAQNGHQDGAFASFAAPRAHRPGAEGEE